MIKIIRKTDILYEDDAMLVCIKPAGIPSQSERGAQDMVKLVKVYLAKEQRRMPPEGRSERELYLAIINRLDQPVEGLLLFAKTKESAAKLSAMLQRDAITKRYLTVIKGVPEAKVPGEITALQESPWTTLEHDLSIDHRTNLVKVLKADAGHEDGLAQSDVKHAVLRYRLLGGRRDDTAEQGTGSGLCEALAEVELVTGRHHQIRAQMTAEFEGIVGDRKYGRKYGQEPGGEDTDPGDAAAGLALASWRLILNHPVTGKKLDLRWIPEDGAFAEYRGILERLDG